MVPACWSAIWVEVIILAACYELKYPKNYTSLSDDLRIELINVSWPDDLGTQNSSESSGANSPVTTTNPSFRESQDSVVVELLTDPPSSEPRAFTKIRVAPQGSVATTALVAHFPCNLLWHGGRYWLRYNAGTTLVPLDVRWYNATLILDPNTPHVIETFQESVDVQIKFYNLACTASSSMDNGSPSISSQLQLQLVFCGHSEEGCRPGTNRAQLLHSEEIWPGFEPLRVRLSCELFGQAGRYLIWLLGISTSTPNGNYLLAESRPLHAEWSKQFVFNVHARSIFPCETLPSAPIAGGGSRIEQGITVLFEYPECILSDADRVRVYARKEPTRTSVDPASLLYIAEQRVLKGKHSATFPCALFSENYLEYCFKYVSGARSGAASDVRVDCVPTLPVGEFAGAWGTWSAWTQCSTSCGGGGIRNRYRFCDSPPPRYGDKFCEGKSLQTERCPEQDVCPDGGWSESGPGAALPADSEVVQAEVGPGCRCGCVVHLGTPKPRRVLATSSQSCPGRTFWLIQAEDQRHVIELSVEHFRLACDTQWLKVRDGDSLATTLVAHITSDTPPASSVPVHVRSSGPHLLIEFFSGPEPGSSGTTHAAAVAAAAAECRGGFLAHAQQTVSDSQNASILLTGDGFKLDDGDNTSITLTAVHVAALAFVALVLLLSLALGAQYMLRYRKYQRAAAAEPLSPSHSLHGSTCSTNPGSMARFTSSTTLSEIISLRRFGASRRMGPKHERLKEEASRVEERTTTACAEPRAASLATEDDEEDFEEGEVSSSGGGGGGSSTEEPPASPADSGQEAPANSEVDETTPKNISPPESQHISPQVHYKAAKHLAQQKPSPTSIRRALNFSPQRSEKKRRGRHKSAHKTRIRHKGGAVSPVTEEDQDRRSLAASQSTSSGAAESAQIKANASPTTLQQPKHATSSKEQGIEKTPPHAKASKEKQNRARCLQLQQTKKGGGSCLLARGNHPSHQRVLQAGSSEFSLTGTESEMELDYYDYNVQNASAVPGSYLGMDPAYLIWIPPSTPSPDYTDNVSLNAMLPPTNSGKTSPNNSINKDNSGNNSPASRIIISNQEEKNAFLGYIDPCSPLGDPGEELVALTELPSGRTSARVGKEKETRVEKCSSLIVSPEEDIKFADEDEEEEIDDAERALVKTDDTASKKSNSSLLDSLSGKHIRV